MARGKTGAFQRLERGELSLSQFYKQFSDELADPQSLELYRQYMQHKQLPVGALRVWFYSGVYTDVRRADEARLAQPVVVNAEELFKRMMIAAATPNEAMLLAITRLRGVLRNSLIASVSHNFFSCRVQSSSPHK